MTISYVSGYTDNSVKPRGNITRYETAVMFYNLVLDENKEAFEGVTIEFSDVEECKWYSDAVELLSAAGILMGYEDGTFRGDATISRAEFATITSRFTGLLLDGELPFSDVPDGHWAYDYILTAYNNDWITGYTDGTFGLGKMIIRAEAFAITNRILG